MDFNNEISKAGERLREVRESAGLQQNEFADMFNINHSTYNRYENGGIGNIKQTLILKISSKFNINPSWLMGYDVEKYMMYEKVRQHTKRIPVLGKIAAGIPILAQEDLIDYEYIPDSVNVDFCLKIQGDSMINARIYDGDIVFIRRQPDVENGEIAAVRIDGENATLKRFYKYGNRIVLRAENPKYSELEFTVQDRKSIEIIGKCVFVKFSLEG